MTIEKATEIMESEVKADWKGCNACLGLDIIRKYIPNEGIAGADHDIIYSSDLIDLVEAGITEDDLFSLFCIE